MTGRASGRRRRLLVLQGLAAVLLVSLAAPAGAGGDVFFEHTAQAFWAVPHECDDGSTVDGTLLVQPTRDFESPDTEDPDPTTRVQFLAVCPDGASFSWGAPSTPSDIRTKSKLRRISTQGSGTATDNLGGTHSLSFDVRWQGFGPIENTRNGPGSHTRLRDATAVGQVTFDGELIVDGEANHPTRPPPFIRIDTER